MTVFKFLLKLCKYLEQIVLYVLVWLGNTLLVSYRYSYEKKNPYFPWSHRIARERLDQLSYFSFRYVYCCQHTLEKYKNR